MLTREDLSQIGHLFDQKFDQKFEQKFDQKFAVVKTELIEAVGDVIEQNIMPRFDEIHGRLDRVENRLEGVENKLDRVDGKVNTLTDVLLEKRVITLDDKTKALS